MTNKNFTRKDLSNKIFKNVGFSKNLSQKIIDDLFENIITSIIKSNKIKISSFGTFKVSNKKERIGRNPKTKKEAIILSRKIVKFQPSLILKKRILYYSLIEKNVLATILQDLFQFSTVGPFRGKPGYIEKQGKKWQKKV